MKIVKIYLILFLILISNCSNNQSIDLLIEHNYVDTTFKSQKLDIVDKIELEENDSIIIHSIWASDINAHKNQMIICDPNNRLTVLFNYKTGRIFKTLRADLNLSDSLAASERIITKVKWRNNKSFKYIKISDYPKYGLTSRDLKLISNSFFVPIFVDDSILISTIIYCQSISPDNEKVVGNRTAIIRCDNNLKIINVNVLDINDQSYAIPYTFYYNKNNNKYIVSATDFAGWRHDKKTDSLPLISEFNYEGNIIENILYLSDKYSKSQSGYNIPWNSKVTAMNNEIFFTISSDLCVYGIKNRRKFSLINLPFSNDTGFALYQKMEYLLNNPEIGAEQQSKNLYKLFPVQIINCFKGNNNVIIQLIVSDYDVKNDYYYILQEYSVEGDLISQTNIFDDKDNKIMHISFDEVNNYLLLFKKSKIGWTLEKREWR